MAARLPPPLRSSLAAQALAPALLLPPHLFPLYLPRSYGEVVDPAAYPDFETFMAAVQRAWDTEWEGVFTANPQGVLQRHDALCMQLLLLSLQPFSMFLLLRRPARAGSSCC